MKQLLILSGKGGTGKTTIAGAFIKLSKAKAYADCDVDAPNLHLILNHDSKPTIKNYYGLPKAEIDYDKFINCGLCQKKCRFDAISKTNNRFDINYFSCEGCGVCEMICPVNAISMEENIAGKLTLYNDEKVFSTAELKMGNGTSGKLVSEVKSQMYEVAKDVDFAIIDGSPGIGCPVIASLSGVDLVLIVAEPSISGITDMKRIIATAQKFGVQVVVCINKYDINLENSKEIEKYCLQNNLIFAGKIPYDISVVKAINSAENIVNFDCPASDAITEVYKKVIKLLLKERKNE